MKRTTPTTMLLVALAILVAAAGTAVANGPPSGTPGADGAHDESQAHGGNETAGDDANASERGQAMRERYQALAAARRAALDGFHENRTRILDEYRASLNATRASFLENKTAVLEACRAEHADNSSEGAQCVRDGLKPLIEKARADNKAAREKALADLAAARDASIAGFRHAKADADARYGRPDGAGSA